MRETIKQAAKFILDHGLDGLSRREIMDSLVAANKFPQSYVVGIVRHRAPMLYIGPCLSSPSTNRPLIICDRRRVCAACLDRERSDPAVEGNPAVEGVSPSVGEYDGSSALLTISTGRVAHVHLDALGSVCERREDVDVVKEGAESIGKAAAETKTSPDTAGEAEGHE